MKLSLNWLKAQPFFAYASNISVEGLAQRMPLRGFEVESIDVLENDVVIDFAITPNRGDCMSMRGLAREIASLYDLPFQDLVKKTPLPKTNPAKIALHAPEACRLYTGCLIENIPRDKKTPAWIVDRLAQSAIESLHPVVDICNYVMLEYGQPMHAFDADKIKNLQVRFARAAEKVTVIGGESLTLSANTLVIADENEVHALAGVVGNLLSSVGPHTTNIFLESAHFVPEVIAGRARQYGLQTEAAQRFERGVDPELPLAALAHAVQLILEHLGGKASIPVLVEGQAAPKAKAIPLRTSRIHRILGCEIDAEKTQQILNALGMKVTLIKPDVYEIVPPSFRFDIAQEVDLIEELARIQGYETIPTHAPRIEQLAPQPIVADQFQQLRAALVTQGFREVISYSFIGEALQQKCFSAQKVIKLKNPLSSEFAIMRTSLWPSLLMTWQYNLHRQQSRAKFFEIGRIYFPHYLRTSNQWEQPMMLAGLITGNLFAEQWGIKASAVDFFDAKGIVENLLKNFSITADFIDAEHPMLHPGQAAKIRVEEKVLGSLGRLHPSLQQMFDFPAPVYLFELKLDDFPKTPTKKFQPLSKFPSVRRDFAFLAPRMQPVGEVLAFVKKELGKVCQELILFDVYHGKNIAEDKKSIAFGVVLQALEETLSDEFVNRLADTLIQQLQEKFHLELRKAG